MAEEIENPVTEEEKQKKKQKPAKIKKEKPPREKKEKKSSPILLFLGIFIFFLVLIAGMTVLLYFDVGGLKEPVNQFLNFSDFQKRVDQSVLDDQKQKLQEQQDENESLREELAARETELDTREQELDAREQDLDTRELEADEAEVTASPRPGGASGSSSLSSDIKIAVSALNEMEPATAAKILEGLTDVEYTLKLFRSMNKDARAAILEAMDIQMATSILAALNS